MYTASGSLMASDMLHVTGHSNNGIRRADLAADVNPLPNWVLIGELALRQRLADQNGLGRASHIMRVENPAATERVADRFEMARSHRRSKYRARDPRDFHSRTARHIRQNRRSAAIGW